MLSLHCCHNGSALLSIHFRAGKEVVDHMGVVCIWQSVCTHDRDWTAFERHTTKLIHERLLLFRTPWTQRHGDLGLVSFVRGGRVREKRNGKKGKGAFVLIRAHGVEVLRFQRIFSNRVCLRHDLLAGRIPTRWTKGNY